MAEILKAAQNGSVVTQISLEDSHGSSLDPSMGELLEVALGMYVEEMYRHDLALLTSSYCLPPNSKSDAGRFNRVLFRDSIVWEALSPCAALSIVQS